VVLGVVVGAAGGCGGPGAGGGQSRGGLGSILSLGRVRLVAGEVAQRHRPVPAAGVKTMCGSRTGGRLLSCVMSD
jgi:hypothetical protein